MTPGFAPNPATLGGIALVGLARFELDIWTSGRRRPFTVRTHH